MLKAIMKTFFLHRRRMIHVLDLVQIFFGSCSLIPNTWHKGLSSTVVVCPGRKM